MAGAEQHQLLCQHGVRPIPLQVADQGKGIGRVFRDQPVAAGSFRHNRVAGFMIEYSATPYVLFMLAEYVAIVTMCALLTILFFGGWLPPVKIAPFTFVPGVIWFVLGLAYLGWITRCFRRAPPEMAV